MPTDVRSTRNSEGKQSRPPKARWTQYSKEKHVAPEKQSSTASLGSNSDFVSLGESAGGGKDEQLPAVGSRVSATIKGQILEGCVRFAGETQFKEGTWVGVELDTPDGKNDGTVQGVRYFTCRSEHGIFFAPSLLQVDGEHTPDAGKEKRPASRETEKRQRFSRKGPAATDPARKSSVRWDEKHRSQNMMALKAELADAVEERDLVELRRIVPLASRRASERGGGILVNEVESAQRILDYELQQKFLQHHQEEQDMLLKSHEELLQMLTEVDEAVSESGAASSSSVDRAGADQDRGAALQLKVSTAKALEANLAEMRRGAAERARALEADLESMRQSTEEKLKVLEAKLGSAQKAPAVPVQKPPRSPREEQRGQTAQVRLSVYASSVEALQEAESLGFQQTLNPHYILMSAEDDVARAALANAQAEAKKADTPGTSQQTQLKSILGFIPNTLRRCIRHKLVHFQQWKVLLESPLKSTYNPVLSRFPAIVVFADASGFTRLTESLARLPQGAEKIGDTLNAFFRPLLGLVHEHGGDVIKFSGDALTIIWAAADPAPIQGGQDIQSSASFPDLPKLAAAAAARFCLEVQEEIPRFGNTDVPGCSLTMHIGVGYGMTTLLQLGGLMGRWEYCIAGPALEQISIAEPLASSGETVFSPQARELAEGRFLFEDVPDRGQKAIGYKKLIGMDGANSVGKSKEEKSPKHSLVSAGIRGRMPKFFGKKPPRDSTGDTAAGAPTSPPWWWLEGCENMDVRLIRRFFPSAVGHSSLETDDFHLEEMRRLSVLFCSIQGLDPADDPMDFPGSPEAWNTAGAHSYAPAAIRAQRRNSGAVHAQLILRLIQHSVYALEGSVNKFLVDDKGVLLLVVFGLPPLIHFTDDPTRAVLCAMRLCDLLQDEGLKGHVGVSTGACWCGVIGRLERREYTVLGDVVNLSARLMGQAPDNKVLVDEATRDVSMRTLDFSDKGELKLKGKEKPVRAFEFQGIAKGKDRQQSERFQAPLLTWTGWPARSNVMQALELRRRQSGVVFVSGPGGSGKGEIVELMRAWASQKGFTLLAGQNMDPSGTFACPLLCLQESFRELVRTASKDPFWREKSREQIVASLGGESMQSILDSAPGHTEIYWMLIAMLRLSVGEEAVRKLEPWAPLLNMVVTQLAFAPRMIQAMMERNEQHARADRLSELCTGVVNGFSAYGSLEGGTMILLHIRRSSALLQKRDRQETSIVDSLAKLCLRRQQEAAGREEQRPLVLCVVARREGLRDQFLEDCANECNGDIDLADLDEELTASYLQHLMTRTTGIETSPLPRSRSSKSLMPPAATAEQRTASAPGAMRRKKTTLSVPKAKAKGKAAPASPRTHESPKKLSGIKVSAPDRDSGGSVKFEDAGTERRDADAESFPRGRMYGCTIFEPKIEKIEPISRSSSCTPILKKRESQLCYGEAAAAAQAVLARYTFECTGGNCGEIELLIRDFERQELLRRNAAGMLTPIMACSDIEWLREHCALPEVLVGMAFGIFEQLEPQNKMFLKAASAVPGEFGLEELKAALPEMTDDQILQCFERLSSSNVRALRRVSKNGLPPWENRYQFYSLVLSQASSTLVLERHRNVIRQRTTKFQASQVGPISSNRRLSTLLTGGQFLADNESDEDSEFED